MHLPPEQKGEEEEDDIIIRIRKIWLREAIAPVVLVHITDENLRNVFPDFDRLSIPMNTMMQCDDVVHQGVTNKVNWKNAKVSNNYQKYLYITIFLFF